MQVTKKLVKNYTPGRAGYRPEALVVHIAEGFLAGGYDWFNRPESQVSAHYMVGKKGEIWQFVEEKDTAWHAGGVAGPSWELLKSGVNPNLYTVGIEHEGFTGEAWNEQMYQASSWLINQVCLRWNIPIDRNHIIGHYQLNSKSRSRCPGNGVDLQRLVQMAASYEDPAMIAELQSQIQNLKASQADLLAQIGRMQGQIDTLSKENTNLKQQLAAASSSADFRLKQQVKQLSEEVYTLQQARSKQQAQIDQLKAENASLKSNSGSGLSNATVGDLLGAIGNKILPR